MKPLHPLIRPFAPSNYQAPITQSNVWEVSAWLVGSDIDRMRDEGLLNDQTTGEEISRYVSQQDKALQIATLAGSLPDYYTPFDLWEFIGWPKR